MMVNDPAAYLRRAYRDEWDMPDDDEFDRLLNEALAVERRIVTGQFMAAAALASSPASGVALEQLESIAASVVFPVEGDHTTCNHEVGRCCIDAQAL